MKKIRQKNHPFPPNMAACQWLPRGGRYTSRLRPFAAQSGTSALRESNLPAHKLAVGDLVFIQVLAKPFQEVARATQCWTNHVGVVLATDGAEPVIGESTFPFSRATTWSKFIARSQGGRFAVARLHHALSADQQQRVVQAAQSRMGIFYDTGFNLHSRRQFCSRYAHEVLAEATGIAVGKAQSFAELLRQQPGAKLGFWKLWYFGRIPWERTTVTPASLLQSPHLHIVCGSTGSGLAAQAH